MNHQQLHNLSNAYRQVSRRAPLALAVFLASALSSCTVSSTQPATPPSPAPLKLEEGFGRVSQTEQHVTQTQTVHHEPENRSSYLAEGGATLLYGRGEPPTVVCEPLRATDIELQPGETVSDVAIGDSARWIATPAQAGDPQGPVTHIVVKPKELGLMTNLVIYTNRHTYHLNLVSRRGFMRSVKFSYPEEVSDVGKSRTTAAATGVSQAQPGDQSPITPPGTPLDHGYQIAGPQVHWKPVQAFNDGTHVFIQMPSTMAASE